MKFSKNLKFLLILLTISNVICGDSSTNIVDKINNYLKTELPQFYGICNKAYSIVKKATNGYEVSTLEVESKSNSSATLCVTAIKLRDNQDIEGIVAVSCTVIKHLDLKSGYKMMYFTETIAQYYNRSCLVDDVAIKGKNNIWSKIFGENDLTNDYINKWVHTKMRFQTKDINTLEKLSLNFESFVLKDQFEKRQIVRCNATADIIDSDINTYDKTCKKKLKKKLLKL